MLGHKIIKIVLEHDGELFLFFFKEKNALYNTLLQYQGMVNNLIIVFVSGSKVPVPYSRWVNNLIMQINARVMDGTSLCKSNNLIIVNQWCNNDELYHTLE